MCLTSPLRNELPEDAPPPSFHRGQHHKLLPHASPRSVCGRSQKKKNKKKKDEAVWKEGFDRSPGLRWGVGGRGGAVKVSVVQREFVAF